MRPLDSSFASDHFDQVRGSWRAAVSCNLYDAGDEVGASEKSSECHNAKECRDNECCEQAFGAGKQQLPAQDMQFIESRSLMLESAASPSPQLTLRRGDQPGTGECDLDGVAGVRRKFASSCRYWIQRFGTPLLYVSDGIGHRMSKPQLCIGSVSVRLKHTSLTMSVSFLCI